MQFINIFLFQVLWWFSVVWQLLHLQIQRKMSYIQMLQVDGNAVWTADHLDQPDQIFLQMTAQLSTAHHQYAMEIVRLI